MLRASHFRTLSRQMENGFVTGRLKFVEIPPVKSARNVSRGKSMGLPSATNMSGVWTLLVRASKQNQE